MSFSTNTSTVPSRSWACNLRHHFMGTLSCMWFFYPPNLLDSFFHVLRPLFIPEAGITTSLRNRFLVCSFFTYCFLQKLSFCVITQNTNVWLCLIMHLASSGSGMFGKHTRFPPVQCSPDGTSLSTRDETCCNFMHDTCYSLHPHLCWNLNPGFKLPTTKLSVSMNQFRGCPTKLPLQLFERHRNCNRLLLPALPLQFFTSAAQTFPLSYSFTVSPSSLLRNHKPKAFNGNF